MDVKEIGKTVKEIRELTRMKEELENEIKKLQDSIKDEMTKENTDEIKGIDYKVTWKWIHSENFDTKRFKEEHARLAKRYINGKDTRRFCVA